MVLCGTAPAAEKDLGVTLSVTYLSKWLSKGARAYGNQGAVFETIDLDFYGSGFGVNVTHRHATSSGYVDKERFDYRPYYKNVFFADTPLATRYNISAGYEHYPGLARNVANTTWEWIFAFEWPNLGPGKVVPWYTAHYEYPAGSGYDHHDITGWVHRFGIKVPVDVEPLEQPLNIISEIAYTDGLGGSSVAHDWSYANLGVSTTFSAGDGFSLVPAVYVQKSFEDTVNKHDELYAIIKAILRL